MYNNTTFDNGSREIGQRGAAHYSMVDFYCQSRKRRVNENTVNLQRIRLNTVLNDWEENYRVIVQSQQIIGLSGLIIQDWCNRWSEIKAPSTMNNYISFLNGFLNWAYQIGFVQEDYSKLLVWQKPIDPETLPEEERPPEKNYTHKEIASLLKAIETSGNKTWIRDRAIITLILYSGLRREEVAKLTVKQVLNYGRGKIYCQRKGGAWKLVDVAEDWYQYLDAYLDSREYAYDDDPLFITKDNKALTKQGMYFAIRKYQDKLDLVRGSHVLRHVFISEVEKEGGIAVARDCANHKHIRITDKYDHSTSDQRQAAVNSINYFNK